MSSFHIRQLCQNVVSEEGGQRDLFSSEVVKQDQGLVSVTIYNRFVLVLRESVVFEVIDACEATWSAVVEVAASEVETTERFAALEAHLLQPISSRRRRYRRSRG